MFPKFVIKKPFSLLWIMMFNYLFFILLVDLVQGARLAPPFSQETRFSLPSINNRPNLYRDSYSIGSNSRNGPKFRPGDIETEASASSINQQKQLVPVSPITTTTGNRSPSLVVQTSSPTAPKTLLSPLDTAESTNVVHKFQFQFKHEQPSLPPMPSINNHHNNGMRTIIGRSINGGKPSSVMTYHTHHHFNNQNFATMSFPVAPHPSSLPPPPPPPTVTVDEIVEIANTDDDLVDLTENNLKRQTPQNHPTIVSSTSSGNKMGDLAETMMMKDKRIFKRKNVHNINEQQQQRQQDNNNSIVNDNVDGTASVTGETSENGNDEDNLNQQRHNRVRKFNGQQQQQQPKHLKNKLSSSTSTSTTSTETLSNSQQQQQRQNNGLSSYRKGATQQQQRPHPLNRRNNNNGDASGASNNNNGSNGNNNEHDNNNNNHNHNHNHNHNSYNNFNNHLNDNVGGSSSMFYKFNDNHTIQNIVIPLPAHRLNDRSLATGVIVISQDHGFPTSFLQPESFHRSSSLIHRPSHYQASNEPQRFDIGRNYHYELLTPTTPRSTSTTSTTTTESINHFNIPVEDENNHSTSSEEDNTDYDTNQVRENFSRSVEESNEKSSTTLLSNNKFNNNDSQEDDDNQSSISNESGNLPKRSAISSSMKTRIQVTRPQPNVVNIDLIKTTTMSNDHEDHDDDGSSDNGSDETSAKTTTTTTTTTMSPPPKTIAAELLSTTTTTTTSTTTTTPTPLSKNDTQVLVMVERETIVSKLKQNSKKRKENLSSRQMLLNKNQQLKPNTNGNTEDSFILKRKIKSSSLNMNNNSSLDNGQDQVRIQRQSQFSGATVLNSLVRELSQAIENRMRELENMTESARTAALTTTTAVTPTTTTTSTTTTILPEITTTMMTTTTTAATTTVDTSNDNDGEDNNNKSMETTVMIEDPEVTTTTTTEMPPTTTSNNLNLNVDLTTTTNNLETNGEEDCLDEETPSSSASPLTTPEDVSSNKNPELEREDDVTITPEINAPMEEVSKIKRENQPEEAEQKLGETSTESQEDNESGLEREHLTTTTEQANSMFSTTEMPTTVFGQRLQHLQVEREFKDNGSSEEESETENGQETPTTTASSFMTTPSITTENEIEEETTTLPPSTTTTTTSSPTTTTTMASTTTPEPITTTTMKIINTTNGPKRQTPQKTDNKLSTALKRNAVNGKTKKKRKQTQRTNSSSINSIQSKLVPNKSQRFTSTKLSTIVPSTTTSNPNLRIDVTMPDVIESRKHQTVETTTTTTTTTIAPSTTSKKPAQASKPLKTSRTESLSNKVTSDWNPWKRSLSSSTQSTSSLIENEQENNGESNNGKILIRRPPGTPRIPNNFGFSNIVIDDHQFSNSRTEPVKIKEEIKLVTSDNENSDENKDNKKETTPMKRKANIAKYELVEPMIMIPPIQSTPTTTLKKTEKLIKIDLGDDYDDDDGDENDNNGNNNNDDNDDDGSNDDDEIGEANVPGVPGVDYPVFGHIPDTSFECSKQQYPGFYSDMETGCQVYHSCSLNSIFKKHQSRSSSFDLDHSSSISDGQFSAQESKLRKLITTAPATTTKTTLLSNNNLHQSRKTSELIGGKHSFLCPNGTIFSQEYLICDWWYNVKCDESPRFYPLNRDVFASGLNLGQNLNTATTADNNIQNSNNHQKRSTPTTASTTIAEAASSMMMTNTATTEKMAGPNLNLRESSSSFTYPVVYHQRIRK